MENINLLIESAKTVKIPIFYTSIEMLPTKYEYSARLYTYNKIFARMQRSMPEKMDMSPAVDRKESEMVITKHTASIFIGTDFERMVEIQG